MIKEYVREVCIQGVAVIAQHKLLEESEFPALQEHADELRQKHDHRKDCLGWRLAEENERQLCEKDSGLV